MAMTKRSVAAWALGAGLLGMPREAHARWPDVGAPSTVKAEGVRDAAVVIGVEKYFAVPGVPGAARNAVDWYRFLVDDRRVPVERVHLVRDAQAAREGILEKVEQASKQVEQGGTLWVVFIGHGAPAKDGSEGMFVGVDAQQSAASLYARSVRQSEVAAAAANGNQGEILAIVDACFSGRAATGDALAAGLQPLVAVRAKPIAAMTTLSAGTAQEFAGALPNESRPAFSYLVLGALRGWGDANKDGAVTAREAVDYARKTLAVVPTGRTQTPEIFGAGSDLVLARGASEAAPSLSVILRGDEAPELPRAAREAPEATHGPGFWFKVSGYSALGAAGAFGGLAVYKFIASRDDLDQAAALCPPSGCGQPQQDRSRALTDQGNGQRTAGIASSILSGALGVTGAYLLYRGYDAEKGGPSAALFVGPSGLALTGRF